MACKRWIIIVCALLLLCAQSVSGAQAKSPMATLQEPIDQIITTLNDPAYKTDAQKCTQRNKIWDIARPTFDFKEISRRTIGKPWAKFSVQEKSRFTNVFAEFLGSTYIDKLQGDYKSVKVNYLKELIRGNRALVRTRLLHENAEFSIDYKLKQSGGQWKIYDVLVEEGISLIRNYRVQFSSILNKETPTQLIQRLEKKLAQQKWAPPAAKQTN